jgi:hypothetical protein
MNSGMTRRTLIGSIGAAGLFPPFASASTGHAPQFPSAALDIELHVCEPLSGAGSWRHAVIRGGTVAGGLMRGVVQSGRLEWLVDPASGAVEIAARVHLLRDDGTPVELRDRTVHRTNLLMGLPGVSTAPQLLDAAGRLFPHHPLAGRLDPTDLGRGVVRLRAFESR